MAGQSAASRHLKGRRLSRLLSLFFAREAVSEMTTTRIRLGASPETAWNCIMFYEEVPGRPPLPLRAVMPYPLRTEGQKNGIGAIVLCLYQGGNLVKRITAVDPPRFMQFQVLEQCLGIEGCVRAESGSYEICQNDDHSDVVLTTLYKAYLRPRWLWRPLEKLLTGQLHRHVLSGMRDILSEEPRGIEAPAECSPSRTLSRPAPARSLHPIPACSIHKRTASC